MYTKKDVYTYAGDWSQLFYAKQYRMVGGRADGMRAIDVDNGGGIEFTVYPDRAMDIGRFAAWGVCYSFLSKAGPSAPAYYDDRGLGWQKTFNGGMLTTCGLTQAGMPCVSDGEELGLHGPISTSPAEEVSCETVWDGEVPEIILRGKVRTAHVQTYLNLVMTREIRVKAWSNTVSVVDTVENRGPVEQPYMVIYHMNVGYPLLSPEARFETSAKYAGSADDYADTSEESRMSPGAVRTQGDSEVHFYDAVASGDGMNFSSITNEAIGRRLVVRTNPDELNTLVQWKNPFASAYVMGIEPANCRTYGREGQRECGLETIGPGEVKRQELIIEAAML
jgi:hypothetical protein